MKLILIQIMSSFALKGGTMDDILKIECPLKDICIAHKSHVFICKEIIYKNYMHCTHYVIVMRNIKDSKP